jgi:DNA-binding transcriptional LysR family regulator
MYLRPHRGVPHNEHPGSVPGREMPDWENVRTFLEVAQCGSFRSAAGNLRQSMNALRRRIGALEAQLGVTLFTRHVDGLRVTCEGEQILTAAQRMEGAYFDLVGRFHPLPARSSWRSRRGSGPSGSRRDWPNSSAPTRC